MSLNVPCALKFPVQLLLAIQKAVLVFCSLMLAGVFVVVVFLRYVLHTDLFAYEEWVLVAAFWLYFIGGAQGSFDNTHIRADFMSVLLKHPTIQWAVTQFTVLAEFIVGSILTYWGFLMVLEDLQKYPAWPVTTVWKIPFALPRLGIFVGLLLMTFYLGLHLYVGVRQSPFSGRSSVVGDPSTQHADGDKAC